MKVTYLEEEFDIPTARLETRSTTENAGRFQNFHIYRRSIRVLNQFLQQTVRKS